MTRCAQQKAREDNYSRARKRDKAINAARLIGMDKQHKETLEWLDIDVSSNLFMSDSSQVQDASKSAEG